MLLTLILNLGMAAGPVVTPPVDEGGVGSIKENIKYEVEQVNTLEQIIKQDKEIIELIKIFLECRRKI